MSHRLLYKALGYLSIGVGIAASLCIYKPWLMMYGIALALLGFILAGINIFLNMKYYSEEEAYPKGFLGMFLSSLPVLFMLFMIFKSKQ